MNFMLGTEKAVTHMRDLKAGEILCNKNEQVQSIEQPAPILWIQKFTLVIGIYLSKKSFLDFCEGLTLIQILCRALHNAHQLGKDWLKDQLKLVYSSLKATPKEGIQLLLEINLDQILIHLLMEVPDPQDFLIVTCLIELTRAIDITPLVMVAFF